MNATIAASNPKQQIYDYASLLTKDEIGKLESMAETYGVKRETDIVILTTNDTKGKDVVEYMQDFYDENALGYDKPHGNTVILTVDMQHRDVYLAGFYKAKEYFDDYRLDLMREKITPDLSSGDYYHAFHSYIQTSYQYMGIRPGVDPNNILLNRWFQIIASLAAGAIAVSVMAYRSGGRISVNETTYRDMDHSTVIRRRDDYVRTTTTKRKKPPANPNGGGRGGGGGMSKGGHSHSGSRGKF
ncbi:TPM domain-containing protein [Bacillus sp. FJAT-29790]|nr:TPM domain-containing protein [Bacillus sp. FJAT-29790]MBU8879131.1 TPM domain-containing protein [Bacillus sp. FJAT-29790]